MKLEFGATVGFIHKESVTMQRHTIVKKDHKFICYLFIMYLHLLIILFIIIYVLNK